MKIFITLSLIFFSAIFCFARESSPIDYNSFNGIPIGAKPIGMGESFVALADNADAPYWNPAGLAFLESNLSTFMIDLARGGANKKEVVEREPLQGNWFTYLSFCSSLGGLSWRPLSDFREEDSSVDYLEREIKVNKYALSFAIPYSPKISFGMNISYFYGSLGVVQDTPPRANISTGNGWGLDWGLIYVYSPLLKMGISLENGPAYIYWRDYRADRLPLNLRIGAAIKMAEFLTLASDFEQRFYARKNGDKESRPIYHLGLEYAPTRNIFLRLGTFGESWSKKRKATYTSGLGFKRDSYLFDFAVKRYYVDDIKGAIYSYFCSLSLPF